VTRVCIGGHRGWRKWCFAAGKGGRSGDTTVTTQGGQGHDKTISHSNLEPCHKWLQQCEVLLQLFTAIQNTTVSV
jgi:hypothetical protein